jgi:hypothetical protein
MGQKHSKNSEIPAGDFDELEFDGQEVYLTVNEETKKNNSPIDSKFQVVEDVRKDVKIETNYIQNGMSFT